MKKNLTLLALSLFCFVLPTFAVVGAALNFDGTNDKVICGSILTASYTKEAWVRISGAGQNHIVSGDATGRATLFAPSTNAYKLSAGHNGTTYVTDPTSLTVGTWYHVAVTYDAATTTMKLYRNGVLVATNTAVPVVAGGNDVQLGSHGLTGFLNGSLDEVRIWNFALCQSEIQNNRNCEIATTATGLILNYHFNQGTASMNNAGLTTITDASGFGNNGTMQNFALSGASSNWIAPGGVVSGGSCGAWIAPEIDVQGNGNSIPDGNSTTSALDNTDFGSMSICAGTVSKTFTILNTGNMNLTVTSELLSGVNASDFTLTTPATSPILPSGSTSFVLTFNPSAAGVRTATITVNNSDCNEGAYDFVIQGTGSNPTASPVSQTDVSCLGGSNGTATVLASNGVGPYTYAWSPSGGTGVTGTSLSQGSYTCTVSDANGCTVTQTFTITQPATAVSATSSQTDVTCNGGNNGTGTVVPSGGTPGYSYAWSPSGGTGSTGTGLNATSTYTCTISDANGCTTTQTFSLTQPTAVLVSTSQTSASCTNSDGTATAVGSGGNGGPYGYSWNPSGQTTATATAIPAANYTCTVSDVSGCTGTGTIVVTATPCGPTQLAPASCGVTLTSLTQPINCIGVMNATNYRYKFMVGATLVATYTRGNYLTNCVLANIPGIAYATTYQVSVATMISNVWGPYGSACNVTTPAFPTTQVSATYCGATLASISAGLNCDAVTGATNYQWKVVNTSLSYSSVVTSSNNATGWRLSNHPGVVAYTPYTVTVRAKVGGVWGSFGNPCTVTTGHATRLANPDSLDNTLDITTEESDLSMAVYPNPVIDGNIFLEFTDATEIGSTVTIDLYDSYGRLIFSEETSYSSGDVVNLQPGDLASGFYFIKASMNGKTTFNKVVVQK